MGRGRAARGGSGRGREGGAAREWGWRAARQVWELSIVRETRTIHRGGLNMHQ